jgi:hypothetical protein
VYLAPADPFGWIDDPPGVNRLIGLYWLTALFYPDQYQENLGARVSDFYARFYGVKPTDRQIEVLIRQALGPQAATAGQINVPLLGAEPVPLPNASPRNASPTAPEPTGRPPGRGGLGTPLPPSNPPGMPP